MDRDEYYEYYESREDLLRSSELDAVAHKKDECRDCIWYDECFHPEYDCKGYKTMEDYEEIK